jgi:drug/metabolite transporter (DMT)-like permease
VVRYTLLRFLIFFGVVFVLWLVGLRSNTGLLLGLSAVLSVAVSFVLLRGMRDDLTRQLQERFEAKAQARSEASADELAEDAEADRNE